MRVPVVLFLTLGLLVSIYALEPISTSIAVGVGVIGSALFG